MLFVFGHFFIFTFGIFLGTILLQSLFDIIRESFIIKDFFIVLFSAALFSFLFSIFCGIWARPVSITINDTAALQKIENSILKLSNNKNFIVEKEMGSYIISSSKLYEWFYGKTIINIESNSFIISGARCVLKKHFPFVKI